MSIENIKIKNFTSKKKSSNQKKKIITLFKELIDSGSHVLSSMDKSYRDSYSKKTISSLRNVHNINLIGIGGSALGSKAIFNFLKPKTKVKFIDNFTNSLFEQNNSQSINLIIS